MESFMKADVFFFISSLSSIVLSVLAAILLLYLIGVARNLHSLTEMIKEGVENSGEFIEDLGESIKDNMFFRMLLPSSPKRRRATTKK